MCGRQCVFCLCTRVRSWVMQEFLRYQAASSPPLPTFEPQHTMHHQAKNHPTPQKVWRKWEGDGGVKAKSTTTIQNKIWPRLDIGHNMIELPGCMHGKGRFMHMWKPGCCGTSVAVRTLARVGIEKGNPLATKLDTLRPLPLNDVKKIRLVRCPECM